MPAPAEQSEPAIVSATGTVFVMALHTAIQPTRKSSGKDGTPHTRRVQGEIFKKLSVIQDSLGRIQGICRAEASSGGEFDSAGILRMS